MPGDPILTAERIMTPELTRAIENIYSVFENVERPKVIDACPCCLADDEISTLLSKRIREITPNELSGYASSVFLTVGAEEDFRYFLPRILEILSTESSWWPDPEVVGRALGTYSWDRFTLSEQTVLGAFFGEVFNQLVSAPKIDGGELDSWLCCSSHIVPNWDGYLEVIGSRSRQNCRGAPSQMDSGTTLLKRHILKSGLQG
jgi:hypothetical protein